MKPAVNALTVDVEDYFHAAALSSRISSADWDRIEPRVEKNTHAILDLFGQKGVTATFFVLGWVAERFPRLVQEIDSRGHEVACHGYSHQLIYKQSIEEFRRETFLAKRLLEDTISKEVVGYRAASYSVTEKSLWALDVIAEAGFLYDSSIVPARHDIYGIPGECPEPHKRRTAAGHALLEYPPTTLPLLGRNVPVAGGGYFRIYPYWLSRFLLRRVTKIRSAPFIFYVHPWEVDPDQPRVGVSGLSKFRHYVNLDRTMSRLSRLLSDFQFDSVRAVLTGMGIFKLSS